MRRVLRLRGARRLPIVPCLQESQVHSLFLLLSLCLSLSPPPSPSHTPLRGSARLQLQNRRLSFTSTRCSKRAQPCSASLPPFPPPPPTPGRHGCSGSVWWECSVCVTRCVVIRHTWQEAHGVWLVHLRNHTLNALYFQ